MSVLKIKKENLAELSLVRNDDIVATLASRKRSEQIIVAFAAETSSNLLELAEEKLKAKGADFIYVNLNDSLNSVLESTPNTVDNCSSNKEIRIGNT